jgi:hypothetical protein
MDMAFVHGMKYTHKDEDGRLISSLDGYNSYLLIVYSVRIYSPCMSRHEGVNTSRGACLMH